MMVLHDAIKTIQNGVCVFKEQRLVSFIKNLKSRIKENTRAGFFKKPGFFSTLITFQVFFVIFP